MTISQKPPQGGLGRGLSVLLEGVGMTPAPIEDDNTSPSIADMMVSIDKIVPNENQPRQDFDVTALQELAASIKEKGVLQPILVRPHPEASNNDKYQIVSGERRWRASKLAELTAVPVLIRNVNDSESLEIALIENVQRTNLNPVEEAEGMQTLIDQFSYSQENLATAIGKSRSHISNTLRILTLPNAVLAHVRSGEISLGHARNLVMATDAYKMAQKIIAKKLSVRQTEQLIKQQQQNQNAKAVERKVRSEMESEHAALISKRLSSDTGLDIAVRADSNNTEQGKIVIRYKSPTEFKRLCEHIVTYKPNQAGFTQPAESTNKSENTDKTASDKSAPYVYQNQS